MSLSTKIIPFLWWLIAPILVAQVIISIAMLFIETKQPSIQHQKSKDNTYKYSFPKLYQASVVQKRVQQEEKLGNLKLKACYVEKGSEFVVLSEGTKTLFIDLEKSYKGVKLIEVKRDSATFLKNGKYFELNLVQKKKVEKTLHKESMPSQSDDQYVSIKRDNINRYTKNPKQALRDIRFYEMKIDKKFVGLKLSFVRKGSLFDKLKLKKGDIIKTVNGNELNSALDLLPYYNLLENSTTLSIGFERDGDMREILYEIN